MSRIDVFNHIDSPPDFHVPSITDKFSESFWKFTHCLKLSLKNLKEYFLNEELIISRKLPLDTLGPFQKVILWFSHRTYLLVFWLDYIIELSLSNIKKKQFNFHWHLKDHQYSNPNRRRQNIKLEVELSNWLTVFLMTSCQSLLKFPLKWAFKLTRFFKPVLTDSWPSILHFGSHTSNQNYSHSLPAASIVFFVFIS